MADYPESGFDRICGIVALLFWSALLVGGLGVTIIVGVSEIAPRQAGLLMIPPVLAVWALASCVRSLREAALAFFF